MALGFSVFVSLGETSAQAQSCDAVLGAVREKVEIGSSRARYSQFDHFLCREEISSYQAASDAGGKLGIDLSFLSAEFGGAKRDSEWKQYQQRLCESLKTFSSLDERLRISVETANAAVVAAWEKCVTSPGLRFWVETNASDPYLTDLVARYNPDGDPTSIAVFPLRFFPKGRIQCDGDVLADPKGLLGTAPRRVSCEREAAGRPVNITLKTQTKGDRPVQLGRVEIPPPPPPPPPPILVPEVADYECLFDRSMFADDGVRVGDKNLFSVACDAPGEVESVDRAKSVPCTGGGCPYLERFPTRDNWSGRRVNLKFVTNSGDRAEGNVRVRYKTGRMVCASNCK